MTARTRVSLAAAAFAAIAGTALADPLYINEIYLDPPGSTGDALYEYIELRGTPNQSLDNHYLILLENENNAANTGSTGTIEMIFDLNGRSIGTNGFLTIRQRNATPNQYTVAPGTTDLVNTGTSVGFGHGAGSSIGVVNQGADGRMENSGFTAFLIRNDSGSGPTLGLDLDAGNNGMDHPSGQSGWSILDGIGVFSEAGESQLGRVYAQVNFGAGPTSNLEPGASYVNTPFEIEYLGRWGSSTGQTPGDWHATNLTDNPLSGFTGNGDWRQSAEPHITGTPESSRGVPYGTNLTNTLGRPNYPIPDGDLNQDGLVGLDDLSIVLDNWGETDLSLLGYWLFGDPDGDGFVGLDDLSIILDNWGVGSLISIAAPTIVFSTPESIVLRLENGDLLRGGSAVPEPGAISLLALGGLALRRRNRAIRN